MGLNGPPCWKSSRDIRCNDNVTIQHRFDIGQILTPRLFQSINVRRFIPSQFGFWAQSCLLCAIYDYAQVYPGHIRSCLSFATGFQICWLFRVIQRDYLRIWFLSPNVSYALIVKNLHFLSGSYELSKTEQEKAKKRALRFNNFKRTRMITLDWLLTPLNNTFLTACL